VLIEVLLGVNILFSLTLLLFSYLTLRNQVEVKMNLIQLFETLPSPTGIVQHVDDKLNNITDLFEDLLDNMGNPLQMLVATAGPRLLDKFFPSKMNPLDFGGSSILPSSPSEEAWPEKEVPVELQQDVEEKPESNS
jgi:hypothetical protein